MKYSRRLSTVDTHTNGAPTRIIVDGIPHLKGQTMMEKKLEVANKYPWVRTVAMYEPRGHEQCFGAVLTEPCNPEADAGIFFIDPDGFLNMCGHGTIGVVTMLLETGRVKAVEPFTDVVIDTPSGLVKARAEVRDGEVISVSFKSVPSFLYKENVYVDVPDIGKVKMDIAFGGSFFAIVKAKDLGLELKLENMKQIQQKALDALNAAKEQIAVQHPLLEINTIDLIELYGPADVEGADLKNCVVLGVGQVDRSPCGTGTCAKLATLFSKGEIGINQKFVHESILGNTFIGRILEETEIADYKGVYVEITGSAYVSGFYEMVIDEKDPLKYGFKI